MNRNEWQQGSSTNMVVILETIRLTDSTPLQKKIWQVPLEAGGISGFIGTINKSHPQTLPGSFSLFIFNTVSFSLTV